MTDPKAPNDLHDVDDPDAIPVLTDVIVPGRPPIMRPVTSHEPPPANAAHTPVPAPLDPVPADEAVREHAGAHAEAPDETGRVVSGVDMPVHERAASEPPVDEALANDASPREVPMSDVPAGEAPVLAPSSAEPGAPLAGEARQPHETAPEAEAPETEAPEAEAPEAEAPETEAPEAVAPEAVAPEAVAPETEAPETEAPETEAPETEAPEASLHSEQPRAAGETEASIEAMRAAELAEFVEPQPAGPAAAAPAAAEVTGAGGEAVPEPALASGHAAAPLADTPAWQRQPGAAVPGSAGLPPAQEAGFPPSAELSAHDAEHLAERLRVRFAGYLREEGRGVIEARCRDALAEHTSWLVRQVTREVALALEGEVAGWVRDAVREELAAHRTAKR